MVKNNNIITLPADQFGVLVENDMDEKRLIWLVNTIGEIRLRIAVKNASRKYPESKPFVSKLLKNLRLKVPVGVYAPVNVPIYRVYIFVLTDHSKIKIGISGDWIHRAYSFLLPKSELCDLFDLSKTVSFVVSSKTEALDIEKSTLRKLSPWSTESPYSDGSGLIPWGIGGNKEWLDGIAYADAIQFIANFNVETSRSPLILSDALRMDIWQDVDDADPISH